MTGEILAKHPVSVTKEQIEWAVSKFVGEIEQVPPMYSAIKINGKKLYELARQGKEVERKARKVTIYGIKVLSIDFSENEFTIEVSCSKGTYIRTLCKDIGEFLGCGAAMKTLVRTRVSEFFLEQALTLGQIEQAVKERKIQDYLIPIDAMFSNLKDCVVSLSLIHI